MISRSNLEKILDAHGYDVSTGFGGVLIIRRKGKTRSALLPPLLFYSYFFLRMVVRLNKGDPFRFEPKVEVGMWKIHHKLNKSTKTEHYE